MAGIRGNRGNQVTEYPINGVERRVSAVLV